MLSSRERVNRARENFLARSTGVYTAWVQGEVPEVSCLEAALGINVTNARVLRRFKVFVAQDELGNVLETDANGNPATIEQDIAEPDKASGYWAQFSAVALTPEVERVLREFQREEANLSSRELYGYRQPRGTAELLFNTDSQARERYLEKLRQKPPQESSPLIKNDLKERWSDLPPDSREYQAYMDGLNDRLDMGPVGLLAVTSKGAQQTLDRFREDLTARLKDAVARGDVTDSEQATMLYNELVESAIRDNTLFTMPDATSPAGSLFADQDSWMRWVSSLAKEVLAPVLSELKRKRGRPPSDSKPAPTRKYVKRRGYTSPDEAARNRNRTLDSYFN